MNRMVCKVDSELVDYTFSVVLKYSKKAPYELLLQGNTKTFHDEIVKIVISLLEFTRTFTNVCSLKKVVVMFFISGLQQVSSVQKVVNTDTEIKS